MRSSSAHARSPASAASRACCTCRGRTPRCIRRRGYAAPLPCVASLERFELFAHDENVPRGEGQTVVRELSGALTAGDAEQTARLRRASGAVTALELLARAAPAGVVAAELLLLRLDDRPCCDRAAAAPDRGGGGAAGCCDRLRSVQRLVLVGVV